MEKIYIGCRFDSEVNQYISSALKKTKGLSEKTAKEAFLVVLKDYFEDRVSLNVVSAVAFTIFNIYSNPALVEQNWDSHFGLVLSYAAEVDYYIQSFEDTKDMKDKDKIDNTQKHLEEFYRIYKK
jgi:hypothetical protein